MNTRIRELRKLEKLTQKEFAEKLGLSENYIHLIERGDRQLADRTTKDLCRIFHVNEEWLRTGKGSMYSAVSRDIEIVNFMQRLLRQSETDSARRLILALSRLTVEEWAVLEKIARDMASDS